MRSVNSRCQCILHHLFRRRFPDRGRGRRLNVIDVVVVAAAGHARHVCARVALGSHPQQLRRLHLAVFPLCVRLPWLAHRQRCQSSSRQYTPLQFSIFHLVRLLVVVLHSHQRTIVHADSRTISRPPQRPRSFRAELPSLLHERHEAPLLAGTRIQQQGNDADRREAPERAALDDVRLARFFVHPKIEDPVVAPAQLLEADRGLPLQVGLQLVRNLRGQVTPRQGALDKFGGAGRRGVSFRGSSSSPLRGRR
mmetsp:Transcript_20594/g.51973  ORF Transcript_20594/g.51973 Transcript_20594/m.51973 type:complete len:252 (+) Transcript_20594:2707-3462(+)